QRVFRNLTPMGLWCTRAAPTTAKFVVPTTSGEILFRQSTASEIRHATATMHADCLARLQTPQAALPALPTTRQGGLYAPATRKAMFRPEVTMLRETL